MTYPQELEKAQQVAEALNCLIGFIDELGVRYEPLIAILFNINHGTLVKGVLEREDGETLYFESTVLVGGLHDYIEDLSEVIKDLQLEMEFQ